MVEIKQMAKNIKLGYLYNNLEDFIKECEHLNTDSKKTVKMLLERELLNRKENGIKKRLRYAKFPCKKYLEDFDRDRYTEEIQTKFKLLDNLSFIENKENIILIGSPGSGKTHYATALGVKACLEGKTVLFTSVPNLILELKEAMSLNQINIYKRKFQKYDLVILDELGYVSFDKSGCEILFNLLSNRNDSGSIIITTTNLAFERWGEIFKDVMITGAIVDRLAHRAHIMDLSTDLSYRLEDTINWKKNLA